MRRLKGKSACTGNKRCRRRARTGAGRTPEPRSGGFLEPAAQHSRSGRRQGFGERHHGSRTENHRSGKKSAASVERGRRGNRTARGPRGSGARRGGRERLHRPAAPGEPEPGRRGDLETEASAGSNLKGGCPGPRALSPERGKHFRAPLSPEGPGLGGEPETASRRETGEARGKPTTAPAAEAGPTVAGGRRGPRVLRLRRAERWEVCTVETHGPIVRGPAATDAGPGSADGADSRGCGTD